MDLGLCHNFLHFMMIYDLNKVTKLKVDRVKP